MFILIPEPVEGSVQVILRPFIRIRGVMVNLFIKFFTLISQVSFRLIIKLS